MLRNQRISLIPPDTEGDVLEHPLGEALPEPRQNHLLELLQLALPGGIEYIHDERSIPELMETGHRAHPFSHGRCPRALDTEPEQAPRADAFGEQTILLCRDLSQTVEPPGGRIRRPGAERPGSAFYDDGFSVRVSR